MAGPAWPKRLTGRGWPRLDAAPGYPLALLNPARRVLTRHSGQRNLRGPCFRHRWLPARLEWTEAAIAVGPASECPSLHECDNPTAGLALRLQLPAGRAPKLWPASFEGCPCFDWHFKKQGGGESGGEIVLKDPTASFAETIFLCRTADVRKAVDFNEWVHAEIGWNVAGGY